MKQFHRGGLCVRCCGLSTDPEGRANFGHPFEAGSLRRTFSIKRNRTLMAGLTLYLVYPICRLLHHN